MLGLECSQPSELLGAFPEHLLVDDRVLTVDALGLVAGHLHGRAVRHTSALQVPDRRPAKVIEQHAGMPGPLAGGRPRHAEATDRHTVAMENPWNDLAGGALDRPGALALRVEHGAQFGRSRSLRPSRGGRAGALSSGGRPCAFRRTRAATTLRLLRLCGGSAAGPGPRVVRSTLVMMVMVT